MVAPSGLIPRTTDHGPTAMFSLASKARPFFGAVVLTCVMLTAGGIYSAPQMPSSVYPEVTLPPLPVVAKVPDRRMADIEGNVTRKLEEAVRAAPALTPGLS